MPPAAQLAAGRLPFQDLERDQGTGTGHGNTSSSSALLSHSQLTRSLERILEEAHFSGELILTNRKLKDFPRTGTKYSLTDTVIAGGYINLTV